MTHPKNQKPLKPKSKKAQVQKPKKAAPTFKVGQVIGSYSEVLETGKGERIGWLWNTRKGVVCAPHLGVYLWSHPITGEPWTGDTACLYLVEKHRKQE